MASSQTEICTLRLSQGAFTSAGIKEENEDCIGGRWADGETVYTKGFAAVISDGVSAASGGKVAAELCVNGFLSDFFSTPDSWSILTSASRVLDGLNRWLYGQANAKNLSEERGYVCTFSSLIVCSRSAYLFHIGDSRIYRIRNNTIEQLTRDHRSAVGAKNDYLNRAMGLNLHLKADYKEVEVEVGDLFVLCTDGVHDWVSDKVIKETFTGVSNLDEAAKSLSDRASAAQSDDNLSCIAIRIDELPEGSHSEVQRTLQKRPFPPIFAPGMKVDGLSVEKVIFESSRSQLYEVVEEETGRRMVMKTPSPNFNDDLSFIERFITEEWIGKRISHPNIVKIIDRKRPASFLYYLMESLEGVNLASWLKEKKPSVEEIVSILEQTISGVRALHRKETLHQDLKLENIFINPEGKVKVIDLGSCSIKGIANQQTEKEALTTVDFAAPEYRLNTEIGHRSDQFSIAMVGYHALSGGKPPYGDKWESASSLRDFSLLQYQSLAAHNPMVPIWMDGAFKKALSLNPALRYDALSEFLADLKVANPAFFRKQNVALLEKNPLVFWKSLSFVFFLIILGLIFFR